MEKLKEHKIFRNQLIIVTVILLVLGFTLGVAELVAFGFIFLLIATFNIFSYRENLKDYKKLND